VGQRGFWDEQQRVTKLKEKKPVLRRLAKSIPWQSFRPLLDKGYVHERKRNAGRKRIDPLILFKMLVLQQLFNLSDEELEFQVNDRRSFEEFVGLGVMDNIVFRTRLQWPFSGSDSAKQGLSTSCSRCLRDISALRVSKPVAARSSMQLLSQFPSNAIPKRRMSKSRLEGSRMAGTKTQIDCSRRT
jgi:hypothetical protein